MAGSITDESTVNDRRSKLSKFRAKFTSSKNGLQKEILFFNTNQHCPTCSQGILEEHKDTMLMTREDKMTELETAMSTLGKELTKIEERVDSIETVRYDIGDIESKISRNNNSISAINKYITKLHNEINTILASDVELMDDSELNRLNVLLDKLSNNKYELLEIQQHHLIVASMLKDTGIKTRIIRNYLPAMNKLINKYLSAMNFSVSFSLDENFTEIIKSRYRDEFSYASFSEGEKLRIDLALLFTWREVAKLRNSTNCNLLILDEVFDSSLDQTGIDDFLAILRTLGKETNTFVISHKGAEIESKFDKLLRVKKQKNFSTIL
jgi:chromosome segregation ATPase